VLSARSLIIVLFSELVYNA